MQFVVQKILLKGIDSPKVIILMSLLLISVLAVGIVKLEISNDFRVYLSQDNPQLQAFEKFENNYVKSNSATFVITARSGDIFNPRGLKLIEALTEEAWSVDYADRVSSVTNYLYTRAFNDEIETNYLVENVVDLSAIAIKKIRQIALNEKRLIQSLMTADGKLALVFINLNLPNKVANASIAVTEKIEAIRDRYRKKYPDYQIDNGGSVAFNTTLARAVAHDLSTLLPISYLIIFTGLFFFLKNFSATIAIFILITACLVSTFGFFGWFAPVLTPIAGFAPSILLSIMVADSVHILINYLHQLKQGVIKRKAILMSLELNLVPVLITSVTTIIGFLSLNLSASPPYRDLGNMVAFGVLLALIFSLFLLPALMMLLPTGKLYQKINQSVLSTFAEYVIVTRKRLFILVSLITISLIIFIPNNKVSDNWAHYFDDSFEIIQLVKRIDGYLSGINSLEYSLASNKSGGIYNAEYLSQMDSFEQWFLQQPKVVNVRSLSALMKELNQVMHNDKPEWYKVPESSDLAAQYLLFYEFGLPKGLGLNNLVTIHKEASRFSVSISDAGSDELLLFDQKAQKWLLENAPAIKASPATGLGIVFANIAQRNITRLLQGTLIALVGISIVLMLILKSFKYGLISLVPNIIPAALAYGVWGLTFGYVDISLSIVACSTLGIVVDDTVHFLHKYIRARRQGMSAEDSIRNSFEQVGSALITTSVVLACGFLILAFSNMNTSATIGILMAITLVFALIVDFILLPPLLLYLDKTKN